MQLFRKRLDGSPFGYEQSSAPLNGLLKRLRKKLN